MTDCLCEMTTALRVLPTGQVFISGHLLSRKPYEYTYVMGALASPEKLRPSVYEIEWGL